MDDTLTTLGAPTMNNQLTEDFAPWHGPLHKQTSEATPGLASIYGTVDNAPKTPICIADEMREDNADHLINCWNAMLGLDPQAVPLGQVKKMVDQVGAVIDGRISANTKIVTIEMPTAAYLELINTHNPFRY